MEIGTDPGTGTAAGHGVLGERYRLDELIGVGGTAHVHRATDLRTGRAVAVKVLHPGIDVRRLGVRGLDEVPRHPALVEVLDSGIDGAGAVDGGRGYVVMQLVDGGSLADLVELGPVSHERVVAIGTVIADALAHLHALGVVHRDVKPANVLLDRGGRAFLADLGVARLLDATRVTTTGLAVGTPAYMAPEQVRGHEVGPPADVYALGLVLLEALTGRREYAGAALESAVARIHRRPDVPPHLAPALRTLLFAMTADEAEARPGAAEVGERLGEIAVRPRTAPLSVPPAPRHRSPARITPRRRLATALAGGVVATGGLVVLGTTLLSGPAPATPTAVVPAPAPAAPPGATLQAVPHLATAAGAALEQATPATAPPAPTRAPRVVLRDDDGDDEFDLGDDQDDEDGGKGGRGGNGNENGNGNGKGNGKGNGNGRGRD
ncbi:serine/threonine protein kinase [Pseudonocardia kujensis]|uniref:serine/threonine-protein kinase n=1 Tax=Pseudonocardia kujensis TaxID=1128675 RepID=UPI001E3F1ED6|nr:serine/threonine-protein kinase [Pseudonocardia kujensis]MCE0767049.1 serine/threonine protein kinase [Pseudonocardia kujensis]